MNGHTRNEQLILRWIPVVDTRGRTRLEAVWMAATPRVHASHAA